MNAECMDPMGVYLNNDFQVTTFCLVMLGGVAYCFCSNCGCGRSVFKEWVGIDMCTVYTV